MTPTRISIVLVLCAAALALSLRVPALGPRPMHTDEAVHALKFQKLLENGRYRYDPYEFHGPTLNYLTLPLAWARGQKTLTQVDETTLRLLPALFGIGLVLLWLLIADGMGRTAAVVAALLTALSPAFVFYSRYYIMEILLVFFTTLLIGALYRYSQNHKWYWLSLAGAALGFVLGAIFCGAILAIWVKFLGAGAIADSGIATLLLDRFPLVLALLPSEFDGIRSFFQ